MSDAMAGNDDEGKRLCDAMNASVKAVFEAVSARRAEAAAAQARAEESVEEAKRECARLREEAEAAAQKLVDDAKAEAARLKDEASKEAEIITTAARKERADLEHEKAAMENAHTFQKNKILLDVGGHRFATSLQTLTAVPSSYLE